jgi:NTE family protein
MGILKNASGRVWRQTKRVLSTRAARRWLLLGVLVATLGQSLRTPEMDNESKDSRALASSNLDSYRFENWLGKDRSQITPDLIIVTLSGGGIRAAAFAAATLEELRKFEAGGKPLTDRIVLVSSTSGGSIAAGHIAAHGFDNYVRFREAFLEQSNTRSLLLKALGPRLFYDRSGVMRDYLEDRLGLDGLNFGALFDSRSRPFFIFNSTDLGSGQPFQFVQRDMDLLCTDVRRIRVSTGVTASAALPFLLTDVELVNHWNDCNLPTSLHGVSDNVLNSAESHRIERTRYNFVHAFDAGGLKSRPRPKFAHLADGGLSDNLGMRSIFGQIDIDVLGSIDSLLQDQKKRGLERILILEVNANNSPPKDSLHGSAGSPGLMSMVFLATGIPIDQTSALSADYVRRVFASESAVGASYAREGIFHVQIDLDNLSEEDDALRTQLNGIGMTLTMDAEQLRAVEQASALLLRRNRCFARFVAGVGATAPGYRLPNETGQTGHPYDCQSLSKVE